MQKLNTQEYLGNIKNCYNNLKGISIVETEHKTKTFEGWHSHENAHLTLFIKGGTLEKRKNKNITVEPSSLLFYHSDEMHLNSNTLFPSYNINIEIESKFLKESNFTEELIENSILNKSKVKFIILKMFKESSSKDNFTDDTINMLFHELVNKQNSNQQFLKSSQWIKDLKEILNDCWYDNPSLQSLSQVVNVSPVTISKYFSKYFGCTFGEYMRQLKIEKSLFFIKENKMSLTEIAYRCGFADQSHFIRTFKNQTSYLPKEFQKF